MAAWGKGGVGGDFCTEFQKLGSFHKTILQMNKTWRLVKSMKSTTHLKRRTLNVLITCMSVSFLNAAPAPIECIPTRGKNGQTSTTKPQSNIISHSQALMRGLSYHCDPGSIPGPGITVGWVCFICTCSWFSSTLQEFFSGSFWFSSLHKDIHSKFYNSI